MSSLLPLRRRRLTAALLPLRNHTTSAQYVAARHRDATFEKLMNNYKHLFKVVAVRDLIIGSPDLSLSLLLLSSVAQRLRLNRGAPHFVRAFPRVFSLHFDPSVPHPLIRLTPAAVSISRRESAASSPTTAVALLSRLLSMTHSRSLPLRAIFKVWRELGLPDDFEDSVLRRNPAIFSIRDNPHEINTHFLHLNHKPIPPFTPAVEKWRAAEPPDNKFAFKQEYPPGMRLSKNFRVKVKEWQRVAYAGPYEAVKGGGGARSTRAEKRAVGIVHEFLSLTVEKMVEVEKISQFRKWFGIEMNIRDLFLDHPGIFYLSTKGKRHTVYLREAYDRGRLVETNPIYEARMQLLDLVMLRRKGVVHPDGGERGNSPDDDEVAMSDEVERGNSPDDDEVAMSDDNDDDLCPR